MAKTNIGDPDLAAEEKKLTTLLKAMEDEEGEGKGDDDEFEVDDLEPGEGEDVTEKFEEMIETFRSALQAITDLQKHIASTLAALAHENIEIKKSLDANSEKIAKIDALENTFTDVKKSIDEYMAVPDVSKVRGAIERVVAKGAEGGQAGEVIPTKSQFAKAIQQRKVNVQDYAAFNAGNRSIFSPDILKTVAGL